MIIHNATLESSNKKLKSNELPIHNLLNINIILIFNSLMYTVLSMYYSIYTYVKMYNVCTYIIYIHINTIN